MCAGSTERGRRDSCGCPSPEEFVADAVERDDESRLGRVAFDLLAQFGDVVIDRAAEGVPVAPDFVEQLIAGHRLAAMPDEILQQLKLTGGEFERATRLRRLVGAEV